MELWRGALDCCAAAFLWVDCADQKSADGIPELNSAKSSRLHWFNLNDIGLSQNTAQARQVDLHVSLWRERREAAEHLRRMRLRWENKSFRSQSANQYEDRATEALKQSL
jgi:hypothetical protein